MTLRLLMALAMVMAFARVPQARANDALEHQVKAAFLYNFAKFVGWSQGTFESETEPLRLCIIGDSPFEGSLEAVLKGRTAQGRELKLATAGEVTDPSSCHVAFVPANRDAQVAQILQDLRGNGVLTVGESDAFAAAGGIIKLYLDDKKVRFDVNIRRSDEEGLKISSQLLKLARRVIKK